MPSFEPSPPAQRGPTRRRCRTPPQWGPVYRSTRRRQHDCRWVEVAIDLIRLLIVDDIASTRDNLRKLLGFEEDIEVIGTAGDGKQGLEEAHRLLPDIVLTDVNMPIMDGIQLTERLAQELPASPVIIMSVQGERDYLRRAMQAGAREYLIKPFSHDELVAAIRRVHQLEEKKGTYIPRPLPQQPETPAAPRSSAPAEVFLVFSGKGGVGKTLIASNLA